MGNICQHGTCKSSGQHHNLAESQTKNFRGSPISIPMEHVIGFHCDPNPLLLYCSGKTLWHIGRSRPNRSQPGNSPTKVPVTFAIKDTHKTLQPPDLVFWAFLRVFSEDSTPLPSWATLAGRIPARISPPSTFHLLCDQNHYLLDFEPPPNDYDIHSKIYVDTRIEII